ncbi:hypothetical protein Ae201684_012619 [Aphanomyces euteiches]|uniref:Uncharacterized protein n=1 Tax=Aphanomyces euteiches TaxID=100861 RepID=A0A6G0WR17_9STRA|nr:hypothetical protein Ae201684_012619 [Aphanomyces euteiches]
MHRGTFNESHRAFQTSTDFVQVRIVVPCARKFGWSDEDVDAWRVPTPQGDDQPTVGQLRAFARLRVDIFFVLFSSCDEETTDDLKVPVNEHYNSFVSKFGCLLRAFFDIPDLGQNTVLL